MDLFSYGFFSPQKAQKAHNFSAFFVPFVADPLRLEKKTPNKKETTPAEP
jgi:hypothetical protein